MGRLNQYNFLRPKNRGKSLKYYHAICHQRYAYALSRKTAQKRNN